MAPANVHIGLINACEIRTNGGKYISTCTGAKDKHPPPAPTIVPPMFSYMSLV